MKTILSALRTLSTGAALAFLAALPASAQLTASWSFENVVPGINTPTNLGDIPIEAIDVPSDDGLMTATFKTLTESTQFGIYDNTNNRPIADDPMKDHLLYGGRTGAHPGGTAALEVTFSRPIAEIVFDFFDASVEETGAGCAEWLHLILGAVQADVQPDSSPNNSTGYYYQGHAQLSGFPLVSTVIFSVTPKNPGNEYAEFGLDNLKVWTARESVPEPGATALMVGALLPAALFAAKRRASLRRR
jgi:hypothetical protein